MDPQSRETIDDGIVLFFAAPASSTGEDVLEVHHHGSPIVTARLLDILLRIAAVRLAEPGEFSKRAFYNQKLDLTGAEGLADLIDATTEGQRRQARRQMDGQFGRLCAAWRETIVRALAHIEAEIDFSAEEEVSENLLLGFRKELADVADDMAEQLDDKHRGERIRDGVVVAIAGPPNVGKSTLINLLARREVSIVTPLEGTTRDVIEVPLDLDGMPVTILDTAGLRESSDVIEREGIIRAHNRLSHADLIVELSDASNPVAHPAKSFPAGIRRIRARNKIDLDVDADHSMQLGISCVTGEGLRELRTRLVSEVRDLVSGENPPLITRMRHRNAIENAESSLRRLLAEEPVLSLDLLAEELRLAAKSIGSITGQVLVEELLDEIFASFCIGK